MKLRWAFTKPIDPCDSDICLVRATCKLPIELPWSRGNHCEMYKKFRDHEIRYTKFRSDLNELLFGALTIFVTMAPIALIMLGFWKLYELILPFIKGLWA